MRVFKFGGASVKSASAVKNVAEVLRTQSDGPLLVVISAMAKITNKLESLVDAYYYNKEEKRVLYKEILNFHAEIIQDLQIAENEYYEVENLLIELECIIEKKRDESSHYDTEYDRIVPFGELISTKIVSTYLNKIGYKNRWIDARNFVITTNKNRAANVLWEESVPLINSSLKPLLARQTIVTQGFIGRGLNHKNTTLGREGSDYTAAIFAYALDAESVTIWKDVEGVMNADPRKFENAVLIDKLSYNEAIELAYYGASVIHPKTIQPLKNKKIPLYVKSFLDPSKPGTVVMENDNFALNDIQCYIVKEYQSMVTIATKDFSFIVEDNLELIFSALNKAGIQLNMMQNSAISFIGCYNEDTLKTEELFALLADKFEVSLAKDNTLLTVFNYNDGKSELDLIIGLRRIRLEQKSNSALQLLLN
ncbi:MAG TPA: aspartate kinase [Bacteroidetes bacterium]|jgi:aspartate kinase|nr:aspartate kinase [Bacteroidota bacterium]|tara:strand:+ start:4987 stop:6255 length:1269 start_codon:yes stop_codon:yes gene_type:complete